MSFSNPKDTFDSVIVRLGGEIGIKSPWTRRTYERRLIQNIKATLKHHNIPYDAVFRQQGRIYIKTSQAQKAARKLTKVFGISSLSPATKTTSKLEDITTKSLSLAKRKLRKQNTFAVRCKRVGTHPYTSRDICKHIGKQILDAFPKLQLKVDLTNPEVTIGIEIRENQAYIFTETTPAPDGLPIGTQPKTIALIKPDLNSPVACWLTMKRGCPSVPVYFSENQNKTAVKQVENICRALFQWSIGHPTKLHLIPHSQNHATLKQKCPPHLVDIINKRLIYRITAQIAEKEKAEAIVTGETIGGKPHRALRYFRIQDQATQDYPIHRPLTALTNAEIKKLAQKIGIQKALTTKPKKPEAAKPRKAILPTLKEVEAAENKLNIQEMIDTTLQKLETAII
ncbi:MAG: tRNA sulfurtransferase [Candidatus Bathyarchaeia archaeon]